MNVSAEAVVNELALMAQSDPVLKYALQAAAYGAALKAEAAATPPVEGEEDAT